MKKGNWIKLWEEYEEGKTNESRFAQAMDKLEVLLQHNEADLRFLTKKEYGYNLVHGLEHAKHDEFLKAFRQLINQDTLINYKKNKVDKKLYEKFI